MKYYILAGEASGDLHGSRLVAALKAADPDARFNFFGGDRMAAAVGHEPLVHIRDMAYMGFSEVLRNLGTIRRNMSIARRVLDVAKPDAVILIDYPSFNLKVAAAAARLGIPVYYYISPKIWAWKKWRVRDIKKLVRRVFCILPFEPEFYARYGYTADYVGNPTVDEIRDDLAHVESRADFLARHKLRDRPLIALLPGSRRGEIRNNLPVMLAAAHPFVGYRPVVLAAPGIDRELYSSIIGTREVAVIDTPRATDLLAHVRGAMVTSGTATLEAAIAGVPQVVCYRANGSKISYDLMKRVLDVDFVSLPNLIAGREVVPEMLLHMCTPAAVADTLAPLLRDGDARQAQLDGYAEIAAILGNEDAAANTAHAIVTDLSK
ncbi:MAG: lipid-A-disaccharide synthase [Muribaculaceae bacterium]|nr:lipid-A-disaccharide synthase [Muribaculaceae bacterium]